MIINEKQYSKHDFHNESFVMTSFKFRPEKKILSEKKGERDKTNLV